MWDVFFFGTAFKMPSHISASKPGMWRESEGIDRAAEGRNGVPRNRESSVAVLVRTSCCDMQVCGNNPNIAAERL
jgi:hypothetical protein